MISMARLQGGERKMRKKKPVVISIRTTGLSFGLTGLGENNLRDIKKHFSFVPIWTIRQSFWLTMVWKQVLGYRKSGAIAPSEKGPTELFFGKIRKARHFFRKMVKIYGTDNRVVAKPPFPPRSLKKTRKEL